MRSSRSKAETHAKTRARRIPDAGLKKRLEEALEREAAAARGRLDGVVAFVVLLSALVYAWLAVAAVLRTVRAAITE